MAITRRKRESSELRMARFHSYDSMSIIHNHSTNHPFMDLWNHIHKNFFVFLSHHRQNRRPFNQSLPIISSTVVIRQTNEYNWNMIRSVGFLVRCAPRLFRCRTHGRMGKQTNKQKYTNNEMLYCAEVRSGWRDQGTFVWVNEQIQELVAQ